MEFSIIQAEDNDIPFYVALPSSTFDRTIRNGVKKIPIEEMAPDELRYVQGKEGGATMNVLITPRRALRATTHSTSPGEAGHRLYHGKGELQGEQGGCEAALSRKDPMIRFPLTEPVERLSTKNERNVKNGKGRALQRLCLLLMQLKKNS